MFGAVLAVLGKILGTLKKILSLFKHTGTGKPSFFGRILSFFRLQMVALATYIGSKFTSLGQVFWHIVSIISLALMLGSTFVAFTQGMDILSVVFGGTDGVFNLIAKMSSAIFGSNTTTGLVFQIDGQLTGTTDFCTPACTLTNMSNAIGLGWALNQSLTALINVIAFEVNFWLWALSMKMQMVGRGSVPIFRTK